MVEKTGAGGPGGPAELNRDSRALLVRTRGRTAWRGGRARGDGSPLGRPAHLRWNGQLCTAREILMPDDASATQESAALTERVRFALESGDLDAVRDLLDPGARWGAPEGPHAADCHNREQVIAWWASARAAGARAVVTEVTAGAGTLLVGLEVTGTPAAHEAGGAAERWQVLTVLGDRIAVMTARPGRIKEVLELPFGRPRDVEAVRADPRFAELRAHIWRQLHTARPRLVTPASEVV